MQGVFAAAYHGHIFAAIEKGIAGGAIADAVAREKIMGINLGGNFGMSNND